MGQRVEAGRLGGAVFLVQVGDEGSLDSHCSVGIKGGTGKILGGGAGVQKGLARQPAVWGWGEENKSGIRDDSKVAGLGSW